ncbi:hypothetical protein D3C72_1907160 [compost metagenome]
MSTAIKSGPNPVLLSHSGQTIAGATAGEGPPVYSCKARNRYCCCNARTSGKSSALRSPVRPSTMTIAVSLRSTALIPAGVGPCQSGPAIR